MAAHPLADPDCAAWEGDESAIPSNMTFQDDWSLSKPFILTKVDDVYEDDQVTKRLKEFGALFANSNFRVTEGRAQLPLNKPLSDIFLPALQKKLMPKWHKQFASVQLAAKDEASYPEVAKILTPATFGLAASHISVGKFELNLFPCIRVTWCGQRFVSVVLLEGVKASLEGQCEWSLQAAQEWAFRATASDVSKLIAAGHAMCGTVGPGDALYVPAGALISHRVHSSDINGLRAGLIGHEMQSCFEGLLGVKPQHACVQQAFGFLKTKPFLTAEKQPEAPDEQPEAEAKVEDTIAAAPLANGPAEKEDVDGNEEHGGPAEPDSKVES